MKAIMVMFDSLNRRYLPSYGCTWTHAPNFARLAERTVTFDRAYVGSMPCMPARRELHTGRYNFLHRSWGPLEPFDDSMPEILKENGVHTHLATDHYHYFEDGGATYHTRYSTWEIARGQESDPWKGMVAEPPQSDHIGQARRQFWVNRLHQNDESKQSQTVAFEQGLEFIDTNHNEDNWFLQIENFDPHEPFFSQQKYKDLYPHEYDGPLFEWYMPGKVTETPEEIEHLRYQYAALLSMCDAALGRVLDAMDRYDLWKDTMLIVTTDHGIMLGEHDVWAKVAMPFYQEVANIPMYVWDPRSGKQGSRCDSLAQMIDVPATLLDYFNVERPPDMQGIPLGDAIADNAATREAALFGIHGSHVNVTDGRYVYMRGAASDDNAPLYEYTLMPTYMRERVNTDLLQNWEPVAPFSFTKGCHTIRFEITKHVKPRSALKAGTLLYDIEQDYAQQIALSDTEVENQMIGHLIRLMQENDSPPEQYQRLGLQNIVSAAGL